MYTRSQCIRHIYRAYLAHAKTKEEMHPTETKGEIKKWTKIQKSTIIMVRNWLHFISVVCESHLCVRANADSLISVASLPLSLRVANMPSKCAICTAIWCALAAFTLLKLPIGLWRCLSNAMSLSVDLIYN